MSFGAARSTFAYIKGDGTLDVHAGSSVDKNGFSLNYALTI